MMIIGCDLHTRYQQIAGCPAPCGFFRKGRVLGLRGPQYPSDFRRKRISTPSPESPVPQPIFFTLDRPLQTRL